MGKAVAVITEFKSQVTLECLKIRALQEQGVESWSSEDDFKAGIFF